MQARTILHCTCQRIRQQGSALLIILVIVLIGAMSLFVSALNRASQQNDRNKIDAAALAQAKDALLAFATGVTLTPAGATRPGDLPCPDLRDDGLAPATCDIQSQRLGRLPWKTLNLPDLRDSAGERLWYAVSTNYKNGTRIGTLNSDTSGTITVRDAGGTIVFNGSTTTGAIAVIFAPGSAFTRQDAVVQDRSGAVPCPVIPPAVPALITPHCNPVNYLDNLGGLGEDNKDFIDSNVNGFIQGPISNATGVTIVNDKLITITPQDLMPLLEKRVTGETVKCLTGYASIGSNQGHYPWAAALNPLVAPSYLDTTNARFGRIPDTPFTQTRTNSGNLMSNAWGAQCNIASAAGWWLNWKEMIFYAVANPYKPASPLLAPACGVCLTVNPPTAAATKQVAVFAAGQRLAGVAGGQPRVSNINKGTVVNYLENQNSTPIDDIFERSPHTATFNDTTAFFP